jgi:hypothetical protein
MGPSMHYDGTKVRAQIQISKDHISTQSWNCMWLLEENRDIYVDLQ